MTRPTLVLLLLSALGLSAAQAAPRDQYYGHPMQTHIVVQDSQSREPLIGATVRIVSGADTLRGATKKSASHFGLQAIYECDRIFRDSVSLEISCLGYKPFTGRYSGPGFNRYISAALDPDEQSIAQVVVTGKSIAMIFRGDTTVYNAAAFKTMTDDRLSELLKQLPGVEIRDEKIYADGEEVKRVYVDGRNLFGSQPSASLTDLEASDVKSVRVYEQQSPQARHTDDNTAPKEKVMDVETKSKRGVLWGGEVMARVGASLEKEYSGRHEVRHAERLRLYRHSEKGSSSLDASHSKDDSQRELVSLGSKTTPAKRTSANLSHEYRRGDTTTVWLHGGFDRTRRSSTGSTLTDYFPTGDYTLRREQTRRESLSKSLSARIGSSVVLQRRKNAFHANWTLRYEQGSSGGRNTTDLQTDAQRTFTRIVSDGSSRSLSGNASLGYSFRLSEKSRLSLRTSFDYSDRRSDDRRVDTVASEAGLRMKLHNGGKGERYQINATAAYRYKTGEKSSLNADYNFSRQYDRSERRARDFLNDPRGVTDTVNSYDYTVDYYNHELALSWRYNSDLFHCDANVRAGMHDLARDERFPLQAHSPRRFFSLAPTVHLQLGKSRNQWQFSVGASPEMPSTEQLRATLDATNPLLLRAGNPDLKLPTSLNSSLSYHNNDASSARSIWVEITGGYNFNFVATQDRFFLEDTYLPQYDYTAQQGAQLMTEVNVGGCYHVGSNFSYWQRISGLQSTLRLGLGYDFRQTPYFFNGTPNRPGSHALRLTVGFETGFSTKVKLSVNAATAMSSYQTGQQTARQLTQTAGGRADLRFGKYFGFVGTLYRFDCNSRSKELTRHDVTLSASAGRKFGAKNRFSLSIGAVDVLNRPDYATTRFEANYIRTNATSYLGRYAYLQAGYTF